MSNISPLDAHSASDILYIDVRDSEELAATGRIAGSIHIPLSRLMHAPDDYLAEVFAEAHARTLVTVCAAGFRSASAAVLLTQRGYPAVSLSGGIAAWQAAGYSLVS